MKDLTRRIAELSPEKRALLARQLSQQREAVKNHIQPRSRDKTLLPLSFAQERLWLLHQMEPESPLYNIVAADHIGGSLDLAVFQRAYSEIARRHEILRTVFKIVDDRPVQQILPPQPVNIPLIDLRSTPQELRGEALQQVIATETSRPFDLSQGPLFRVVLVQMANEEFIKLLIVHHAIFDGSSAGVLIREFSMLYDAFVQGRPAPLPELPIQYADFALWQRERLTSEVVAEQIAYWRTQLAGPLPFLALPTDLQRPAARSGKGARYTFTLSNTLSTALRALSHREGVTLFTTLLAAFKVLLFRYTGQHDLIVGTPVSGRNWPEVQSLIGCFINTLAVRTRPSGDISFQDFLKQVRSVVLDAQSHQDLPFEKLVEELRPDRNPSYTPIFQVAFHLHKSLSEGLTLNNLDINRMPLDSGTSKFDLTLEMDDSHTELKAWVEYSSDLFYPETVARMMDQFQALLEGIVADPSQRLATLPLLSQAEQHQMLVEWNRTAEEFPQDRCYHQLFEAQVGRTPDAVAVICDQTRLTYRELNQQANQLAHHLISLGVGPDVLVGICTKRSPDMIISVLAVLKAGGAYVPIDPSNPANRVKTIIEDAQVPVLLTQTELRQRLANQDAYVICLDELWPSIATESTSNPLSSVLPENLAYVIYTSGSTGRPKGVMLHHRGLCNMVATQLRMLGYGPGSRMVQFATFTFDASVWEMSLALASGAALCLIPQAVFDAPQQLPQYLRDQRITTGLLPPSLLAVLSADQLPDMSTLVSGGERCTTEIVHTWALGRRFLNAYGPTESTVCASMIECNSADPEPPTIGRPLPNFQLYVLDTHLQPVPVGVPGELYINGVGLARGYLNRPDLTAERFVPNPFVGQGDSSADGSTRLYKTGDLVRYRSDGKIEYLGRIDHQVKIRGFRIELGEIESTLRRHPQIQAAHVLAYQENGEQRLVAYVVPRPDTMPTRGELRRHLQTHLPEYMVPSTFLVLQQLPLTPSGKVDRAALPLPTPSVARTPAATFEMPQTEIERQIATIWSEVLGVEKVGLDDNFFDLGGQSLTMLKVHTRLQELFPQRDLSKTSLFMYPTVRALARYLGQEMDEQPALAQSKDDALKQREALRKQQQLQKERSKR